jgi:nitrogen fixation protein NifU and related proteins
VQIRGKQLLLFFAICHLPFAIGHCDDAGVYSAQVLDHFQNPRNAGELEPADAVVEVQNPACGDILRLSARLHDGRIAEVRFRAKGCVPAMACASRITEMIAGKTLDEARSVKREDVIASLGGVPAASGHAGQLATDAVRELLEKVHA